jgi:LmbE family N-acetylglucosaminyl deacetylase
VSAGAVLHLSPHPDDELIGAPATLMALRDAGWRVVNLACGLGAPEQQRRREEELREACRRADFELIVPEPVPPLSSDDPTAAWQDVMVAIAAALDAVVPAIVIAPAPGDRHPAHEVVAAVAAELLAARGPAAPRRWLWSLWGSPPQATLATGFDRQRLEEILTALEAHRGELRRNDYRRLVRARSELAACLAPELLWGFGASAAGAAPFAELLTEVVPEADGSRVGASRWLDPEAPLASPSDLEASL